MKPKVEVVRGGGRKDKNDDLYVEQGIKEYRESIVLSMEESIDKLTKFNQKYDKNKLSKLNETLSRIKEAEDFKLIKSIQVTQKFKNNGSLRESATIDFLNRS